MIGRYGVHKLTHPFTGGGEGGCNPKAEKRLQGGSSGVCGNLEYGDDAGGKNPFIVV